MSTSSLPTRDWSLKEPVVMQPPRPEGRTSERQTLDKGWFLKDLKRQDASSENRITGEIPARVPGCVHTDLLREGLIEDPYIDRNEDLAQWIGESDWVYRCRFDANPEIFAHEQIELVCDGLDTVVSLELNGEPIGDAANMHHPHRFDVGGIVRHKDNELVLTFRSAVHHARDMRDLYGERPRVFYIEPYNFIRKMACNFGWDWGPTLTTAGIWKPIYLEGWTDARIDQVRPLVTRADPDAASIAVHVDLDHAPASKQGLTLRATLRHPNGTVDVRDCEMDSAQESLVVNFDVDTPALWWPRGYGDQPLYGLEVTLVKAGSDLSQWDGKIGLRRVELDTSPDEAGSRFVLRINDVPISCRGANWIPDDCFVDRLNGATYAERIGQAVDANMNMLRVWGGGVYESEDFYRTCDELGVMVWQDFLFACAMYPEDPDFRRLVEAEARHQVARLSRHPSLVLWCGNNENLMAYDEWSQFNHERPWKDSVEGMTWGKGLYFDLLPNVIGELDPTRPYCPGSPSSPPHAAPNDDGHGCQHIWTGWHEENYDVYREHRPRFASEFGFQAPPTFATLHHAVPEDQWEPESRTMRHHQKSPTCHGKVTRFLREHFNAPETFEQWVYLAQLQQARALTVGVEWFRSLAPHCMGTLYWQFNDCWPATSWAAIDSLNRPKLLWYATRRFYRDRLLTIQPDEAGDPRPCLANDTDKPWSGRLELKRIGFDGAVKAGGVLGVEIAPRSVSRLDLVDPDLRRPSDPKTEMLCASLGDDRAHWFFERDKDLAYPRPEFTTHLGRENDAWLLTLNARTFMRDVVLMPDRFAPDASVDEQLITLLPGESHTFRITSSQELTLEMLTDARVLFSANVFGDLT